MIYEFPEIKNGMFAIGPFHVNVSNHFADIDTDNELLVARAAKLGGKPIKNKPIKKKSTKKSEV